MQQTIYMKESKTDGYQLSARGGGITINTN